MMSTYSIIHLFQPTECTRVNYNINYGFWVIGMYHCRFINYNKYITLVERMLIIGEATHVCGQGVYGKSLPFSQICSEPETALKKCKVLGVFLFCFFKKKTSSGDWLRNNVKPLLLNYTLKQLRLQYSMSMYKKQDSKFYVTYFTIKYLKKI